MSWMMIDKYYQETTASTTLIRCKIIADTAADLPGQTGIPGYTLLIGCKGIDISTGDRYLIQSGGSWVRQPVAQIDTYTSAQINNLLGGKIPFDLPAVIPASDDLNDYITPGTYYKENGVANGPVTTAGRIDIITLNDANIVQQQYRGPGSTSRIYIRNLQTVSPVSWHPWVPVETFSIGQGISLSNGDDLNNFVSYGVYVAASTSLAASVINRPAYSSPGVKMFTVRCEACRFRILQTLTAVDISSAGYGNLEIFYRIGENDGSRWGSWHQTTTTIVPNYT